jgi:hypothetical protein
MGPRPGVGVKTSVLPVGDLPRLRKDGPPQGTSKEKPSKCHCRVEVRLTGFSYHGTRAYNTALPMLGFLSHWYICLVRFTPQQLWPSLAYPKASIRVSVRFDFAHSAQNMSPDHLIQRNTLAASWSGLYLSMSQMEFLHSAFRA